MKKQLQQKCLWGNKKDSKTSQNHHVIKYVIKIQERLNGGHFPYLSSVTLWAVLPSHVYTGQRDKTTEQKQ